MHKKIGVGIITCNRVDFFNRCYKSIPDYIDELVIINDGTPIDLPTKRGVLVQNNTSKQVGESKNIAMRYLLDAGCEYIFTIEDDVIINDPNTFKHYILACCETGIQHFNFGFSNKENLDINKRPIYRTIVEYKNCKIVLTKNILGALTFFTRKCLQTIGLHHHAFNKGHGDHPELTYRAFKHGFTTPFWWFADLYDSWNMIHNQSNMSCDSLVRNQQNVVENFNEACNIFKDLHGIGMLQVPHMSEQEVIKILKQLKPTI